VSGARPPENWEVLARLSRMEAEIYRAALETAGIPSYELGETVGQIYALTSSELGAVDLLVPSDRVAEARELLDSSTALDMPEGD
jgi:hypothetical protein